MTPAESSNPPPTVAAAFRAWFRTPPRAHGEILEDRVVSFLELFYDLVFVVLIAQIAHTLAGDVSWTGVRDFTIVFALIWIAWLNGSLYHELHGREDGRSRTFIFGQMGLLVLLSVYAAHAADDAADGRGFAIVYAVLLALIGVQWFGIRRYDSPEMAAVTTRYVIGVALVVALVVASAVVDTIGVRLVLWGVAIALTFIGSGAVALRRDADQNDPMRVTESMAERFGLFTIIVLGEVVVGVADGLAEADRSARTIVTGLLSLGIGFGFWWNYFDFIGRREPRPGVAARTLWMNGHFPLSLSIAAAGAGMVSLVEHAADARTPAATAWLIAGATAGISLSLAAIVTTMQPHPGRRAVPYTLVLAAGIALVVGALRPSPIVLVILLYIGLSVVWFEAFIRHARTGTSIVER